MYKKNPIIPVLYERNRRRGTSRAFELSTTTSCASVSLATGTDCDFRRRPDRIRAQSPRGITRTSAGSSPERKRILGSFERTAFSSGNDNFPYFREEMISRGHRTGNGRLDVRIEDGSRSPSKYLHALFP